MNNSMKILPLVACMSLAFNVKAEQIAYSQNLIKSILPPGQDFDISHFEKGLDLTPGLYDLEIKVNGNSYARRSVELKEYEGRLEPVFTPKDLMTLPIKEDVLAKLADYGNNKELFPLSKYLEYSTTDLDAANQELKLSLPQVFIDERDAWTDVAPERLWDHGIPGAIINYNLTASHTDSKGAGNYKSSDLYGSINAQFNIGAWRLYTSGNLIANRDEYGDRTVTRHDWNMWNAYLERDINAIKGKIQIGEISTSGEIFDSIPMRGFRLSTNEFMIPNADRQYSPIVEGFANTNAQILIRQNGRIVFSTNVAAGPFRLENLPIFGSEGDLEVVIKEADGSERLMLVPYSSIPMMLKEGQYRYDVNVGHYFRRDMGPGHERKPFTMGTLSYGLPNAVTIYGGAIIGQDYLGAAIGSGLSLGSYGAISIDATQSRAYKYKDIATGRYEDLVGTAWRIRYQKTMLATGTTINLANLHYLTGNYLTFNDVAEVESYHYSPFYGKDLKSSWQLSLSQSLGSLGSLSGGFNYNTYKNSNEDTKTINFGYNTNIKGVGVYFGYARNYEERMGRGWTSSHNVSLNLNIPLSLFFSGSSYTALSRNDVQYFGSMQKAPNGEKTYQHRATINGYSEDNKWNWSASQTMGRAEERESSVRLAYNGTNFEGDIGYVYSPYGQMFQGGLAGSLILHSDGVTPAKRVYDAVALIEVPEVEGVKVNNSFDTETNIFGYAALNHINTYSRNEINIDPSTLPEGVLLTDTTAKKIYPTHGAIVKVSYPVRIGHSALLYLTIGNKNVPFGAQVELIMEDGKTDPYVKGLVGEKGRVYLSALPSKGKLKVSLSDKEVAYFDYNIPTNNNEDKMPKLKLNSNEVIKTTLGISSYIRQTNDAVTLTADVLAKLSNNRYCFQLKDREGNPLTAGTLVKYVDANNVSEGLVNYKGNVILNNVKNSGKLFVGNIEYVY